VAPAHKVGGIAVVPTVGGVVVGRCTALDQGDRGTGSLVVPRVEARKTSRVVAAVRSWRHRRLTSVWVAVHWSPADPSAPP
jgi:hypothetical protein